MPASARRFAWFAKRARSRVTDTIRLLEVAFFNFMYRRGPEQIIEFSETPEKIRGTWSGHGKFQKIVVADGKE
jgi:hypothetical protein